VGDAGCAFKASFAHLRVEIGHARDAARPARLVAREHGNAA
jgi:hypothetical protein